MPESEDPYHLRPDVVAIHRAIGGYITAFSEVVSTMRHGIDRFFIPADVTFRPPDPLLETLFAQMTADPIRGAFFAISSQVGDLNDEDRAVRKALQALVQYYIQLRNDIAHADWSVGWADADTGEPDQPSAHKAKVGKDGIIYTALPLTAEQTELEVGHINQVKRMLLIWASECRKRQTGDTSSRPSSHLYVYKTSEAVGTAVGIRKNSGELPARFLLPPVGTLRGVSLRDLLGPACARLTDPEADEASEKYWPARPPADRGGWIAATTVLAAALLAYTLRGPRTRPSDNA